jgi:hypothetical protein
LAEGRHTPAPRRIKPAYLVAGVVGALVVIGGVLILITGGSDSPLNPIPHDSPTPTPEFAFKVSKIIVVPTALAPQPGASPTATPGAKKEKAAAAPAVAQTQRILHDLYSNGFLVPDNWQGANYDDVFTAFSTQASKEATGNVDVLTAGTSAGDTYDTIQPTKATLKAKVLMDGRGVPYSVTDIVTFTADGAKKNGGTRVFVSKGQYIFLKTDGAWTITSFSVNRADTEKKPAPSKSGSASGSSEASP